MIVRRLPWLCSAFLLALEPGALSNPTPRDGVVEVLAARALPSVNLGVHGLVFPHDPAVPAGALLVAVEEKMQGFTDLNGDGDWFDSVLHCLPRNSSVLKNLGLALPAFDAPHQAARIAGEDVLALVKEMDQGVDLNADGDKTDMVLHRHDVRTGITSNLGLACSTDMRVALGSGLVWVFESHQNGTDLNGDGDALDRVAHHISLRSGTVENLGVAYGQMASNSGDEVLWGFGVSESSQGADLDGDGLLASTVPFLYQPAAHQLTALATPGLRMVVTKSGRAAVSRDELIHGTDLNGDGDMLDEIVELLEPETGTRILTGLALAQPAPGVVLYNSVRLGEDHATMQVYEDQQGADLNGDGDMADLTAFVIDLTTEEVVNTGLQGTPFLAGTHLLMDVWEYAQDGQDLNGDGDIRDAVVQKIELTSWTTTNVGLAGTPLAPGTHLVAFPVWETKQGHSDLNGDGDIADHVWYVHELATGATVNSTMAGPGAGKHTGPDFLVFLASEVDSGVVDLNGDGDAVDVVAMVYDHASKSLLNPMLASTDLGGMLGRRVLLPVNETHHGGLFGVDLNGDGDVFDRVLHAFDVP